MGEQGHATSRSLSKKFVGAHGVTDPGSDWSHFWVLKLARA